MLVIPKIKKSSLVLLWFIVTGALLIASCGEGTGVCTACCGPGGQTYCKDGWTEGECEEWSAKRVNGLTWHYHEGQSCAERGS